MASLVCWASGLLQVMMDKDVQPDGGPVVICTGTAGRLRSEMTAPGIYLERFENWYVPGCSDVPTEGRAKGDIENDRMTLVITFGKKLALARAKKKGRSHFMAALKEQGHATG